MSSEIHELPYSSHIRALGIAAGIFMTIGTVSGVAMLLLKWLTGAAPEILSVLPMLLLPLAFISLLAALIFAILRRRAA